MELYCPRILRRLEVLLCHLLSGIYSRLYTVIAGTAMWSGTSTPCARGSSLPGTCTGVGPRLVVELRAEPGKDF